MKPGTPERLGAHVSVQGGVEKAPVRGKAIGATAIQVFTKTPSQWREPGSSLESHAAFRRECERCELYSIVGHDSYLINLASPDPLLSARSEAAFGAELRRCEAFGIPYLVSHPGNYIDRRDAGLALVGDEVRHRIAFCADTCHLYSAGYDLAGDYDGVWRHWDRILGLNQLRCVHLNDSKTGFHSRRDRHELIGEGSLGPGPFRRIMTDPRLAHVIKILETPKGDDGVTADRKMLRRLRRYARGGRPPR